MLYATGHEHTKSLVDYTLKYLDVPVDALYSTMGRTAARTLETKIIADKMQTWFDHLIANIKAGDTKTFNETLWKPSSWPSKAQGVGYMEAPRGALAHWIVIKDQKIANYQAVVPSTWNAGRVMCKIKRGRMKRHCKVMCCMIRSNRWRFCAPFIVSTHALPARCM